MMQNPIYRINNLVFSYKDKKNVTINKFELHRGAVYLFSGSMGSGKSSLMKILSKYIDINDTDSIFYEDQDLSKIKISDYNKEIYFLERNNKVPWLSISAKNYMIKRIKVYSKDNYNNIFKRICNSMKISSEILNSNLSSLSEGELRWIEISIAIAVDTKVLIVDYLEKSLDLNRRIILNRILKRKASHDGVTVIASTYNLDFFKMSASVSIKMDRGRITQVRSLTNSKSK